MPPWDCLIRDAVYDMTPRARGLLFKSLSPRQQELLGAVLRGVSSKDWGREAKVKPPTVRVMRSLIKAKLRDALRTTLS